MTRSPTRVFETPFGMFQVTIHGPGKGHVHALGTVVVNRIPHEVSCDFRVSTEAWGYDERDRWALLSRPRPWAALETYHGIRRLDRPRYDDDKPTDSARTKIEAAVQDGILAFMEECEVTGAAERTKLSIEITHHQYEIEHRQQTIERTQDEIAEYRARITARETQIRASLGGDISR